MFNQLPAPLNIAALDAGRVVPIKGWDVYQDVFFSTKVVPIGGQPALVPLVFFDNAEAAGSLLTNVASANSLIPGGHRFHGLKLFVIPMVETAVVPVPATLDGTGIVRDLDRVLKTSRPVLSYTSTRINKVRATIPLDMIGEAGGVLPDFGGNNAPAAGNNAVLQHVRSVAIGGWPVDMIVNENEGVQVNITWGLAQALSAALTLRVALLGWHYIQAG